jgi:aspartyl protease family protein
VFGTTTLILAGIVPRFYSASPVPKIAPPAAAVPADTVAVAPRTVTIRQGDGGHFHLEALIDGQRIQFLVDTGATGVALRGSDAASIGIHPAFRDYTTRSITASGIVRVAPVLLDRVEVGHIVVHNVVAVAFPDRTLLQNLLGILSRVRWQQENGTLVLEQ